jgi:hypothetical protein
MDVHIIITIKHGSNDGPNATSLDNGRTRPVGTGNAHKRPTRPHFQSASIQWKGCCMASSTQSILTSMQ